MYLTSSISVLFDATCAPFSLLSMTFYNHKSFYFHIFAAAKTAINLFLHTPEVTSREKELIKACTDPEMVAAIVGNAKITAPGLTQLKQKQKKGKKTSSSKNID